MKEISLNILDIAKNSVAAGADIVTVAVDTDSAGIMTVEIIDNGRGMPPEVLENAANPFYTTRQTRKFGLGLPFFKMAAELAGGTFAIESSTTGENRGTRVRATFDTKRLDCMPMGDIVSTVFTLVAGSPETRFVFSDTSPSRKIFLDTAEMKSVLGEVPIDHPSVQLWLREYLREQYRGEKNT